MDDFTSQAPHQEPKQAHQEGIDDAPGTALVDQFGESYSKGRDVKALKKRPRKLLKKLRKAKNLNIWLTAIIAVSTVFQTVGSRKNNASTGVQVDRLIDAANRIDRAADRFSLSSSDISRGVSDAVFRLRDQADVAERTRQTFESNSQKALQTTIDVSPQDQRAWVGISLFTMDPTPDRPDHLILRDQNGHIIPAFTPNAVIMNTGRTPADTIDSIVAAVHMPIGVLPDSADETWISKNISQIEHGQIKPEQQGRSAAGLGLKTFLTHSPRFGDVRFIEIFLGVLPPNLPFHYHFPGSSAHSGVVTSYPLVFGRFRYRGSATGVVGKTSFCALQNQPDQENMQSCPIFNNMQ